MIFGQDSGMSPIQLVHLHNEDWIVKQRHAGFVVAKCLSNFKEMIKEPGVNLKDVERESEKIISDNDCLPTFKGYNGFPGAVCLSVNKDMVHGIPKDYVIKSGDIVTLDLGATFGGAISDAALTVISGKPKKREHVDLVESCRKALYSGIKAIKLGNNLGCIGNAIDKCNKSNFYNFSLVTNYGGHSLTWDKPHSDPFVANKSKRDEGIHIISGLTLAIEPMLVIGSSKTRKSNDGWTISTSGLNSHAEHTIFVHDDCVEIMTWREEESEEISNKLFFNLKLGMV